MTQIRIVTDSGSDIPRDLAEQLNIEVVPLGIHFGDKVYADGVDLTPSQFYNLLRNSPELPKTSQPSPGIFAETYSRLAGEGAKTIISIHLSSNLSGTFQATQLASNMVDEVEVIPFDSKGASAGVGAMAIEAARLAGKGKGKDEILSFLSMMRKNLGVYFVVDTLEYLQKNGRIGKAQAFLGGMLKIKPILTLDDGFVAPTEKVRGKQKAVSRVIDLVAEAVGSEPVTLVLTHSDSLSEAEQVAGELRKRFNVRELFVSDIGPTIGVHVGPGTIAVQFYTV